MIITKSTPYTKKEIKKLQEEFDTYIKTVIDIENKICSAGCDRYYESEKYLKISLGHYLKKIVMMSQKTHSCTTLSAKTTPSTIAKLLLTQSPYAERRCRQEKK